MQQARQSQTATTPAPAPDPAGLVDRIRAGDESAWRELSDQYEPLLRWLARQHGLSAEDAADVIQLTWLRCLEHLDQLAHKDRLASWLATICRRECMRLATNGRREVPLSEPDMAPLMAGQGRQWDPCDEVLRDDERRRLYSAIMALPERQRMVVVEVLTREDRSYLDLSHRLGLPVGSIGPTRQRALTRLRRDPRLAGLSSATPDRELLSA
jgi:RNA polymerase sigma factor (sigma-70 family)